MKILVIGGGGREHALASAFAREGAEPIVAPGNAGIARQFACLPLNSCGDIISWCQSEKPDFAIIGPEQPLAEGWADQLRSEGIACVGPSRAAARIESSKIFAKELMATAGVPTAQWTAYANPDEALEQLGKHRDYPLVVKADPLAAGKGVFIAHNRFEAEASISKIMAGQGSACPVLIEEYLRGWEVSLFAVTDGESFVTTPFVQDYKQLMDHDQGPNTGGMGAVCPVPAADAYRNEIEHRIIAPVLEALRQRGSAFTGFLYCGLMITDRGPRVLEFNCRLGDPETQALFPLLETPLSEICAAVLSHRVSSLKLNWKDRTSVCVVLAAPGYPGEYAKGAAISGTDNWPGLLYFSGVAEREGCLVTAGGRVLAVVDEAETLAAAHSNVYQAIGRIDFAGKYYRSDIGLRQNQI